MIVTIVADLTALKGKVQEIIDHVSSGVNNLNEGQIEQTIKLIDAFEDEYEGLRTRTLVHLRRGLEQESEGLRIVDQILKPADPAPVAQTTDPAPETVQTETEQEQSDTTAVDQTEATAE